MYSTGVSPCTPLCVRRSSHLLKHNETVPVDYTVGSTYSLDAVENKCIVVCKLSVFALVSFATRTSCISRGFHTRAGWQLKLSHQFHEMCEAVTINKV